MHWVGVIIVAPMWGIISTQLFLQIWLALINAIINFVGFIAGRVDRKKTGLGFAMGIGSGIIFSLLLHSGYWLLSDLLSFGYSNAENIVYWIFAAFTAIYFLFQIPGRLKKAWRNAMTPGSLEADIIARRVIKE